MLQQYHVVQMDSWKYSMDLMLVVSEIKTLLVILLVDLFWKEGFCI